MIDRDGLVKLTDFGIAKIVGYDSKTLTGDLRLSIAYAAPEVWEGKAEHRSDLYALGIVLYQCLRGRAALPRRLRGALLPAPQRRARTSTCCRRACPRLWSS